jgi:hypothetical protein
VILSSAPLPLSSARRSVAQAYALHPSHFSWRPRRRTRHRPCPPASPLSVEPVVAHTVPASVSATVAALEDAYTDADLFETICQIRGDQVDGAGTYELVHHIRSVNPATSTYAPFASSLLPFHRDGHCCMRPRRAGWRKRGVSLMWRLARPARRRPAGTGCPRWSQWLRR